MTKPSNILWLAVFVCWSCSSKIDFTKEPVVPPANETTDLIICQLATAINTDPNAGGVRNHYVQLYNGTAGVIDLSQYAIGYQATFDLNTLVDWSFPTNATYFKLIGTLGSGKCYVIASPQADATFVPRDTVWGTSSTSNADASTPLQLSGNSGIALLKKDPNGSYMLGNETYDVIDAFGSPDVARVTSGGSSSSRNNFIWTVAQETSDTRNRTFWRKASVRDPNPNWAQTKGTNADDSQWLLSGDRAWDYSKVGLPTPP